MTPFYKTIQVLILILFVGILFSPLLNSQLKIIDEVEGSENRQKASKPNFDIKKLDKYTKDYDNYYTDNFNLRSNLISLTNQLDFSLFNISPAPHTVTVGKEGWFYAAKSAANYKGGNLFSKLELHEFKQELEGRTKWAKENNIDYYVVLIPNKMNVYPEYRPNNILKKSEITRYDQIINLDSFPGINIIDIRKNILAHKTDGPYLYQHTDDHWNQLGAFYGYQEIMKRLTIKHPSLRPFSLNNYNVSVENTFGNMTSIIGVENEYPEHFIKVTSRTPLNAHDGIKKGYQPGARINIDEFEIVKENNNGAKLNCLVIRDSFTWFLIPLLSEHFKKSVYIHDEWKYRMRSDIIEKEKPDIILNIILETEIKKVIEYPFYKTADMFYRELTSEPNKLAKLKEAAKKEGMTLDKMLKLNVLWYMDNCENKGYPSKKTLMYYQFLYEVDAKHIHETTLFAKKNKISFIQSAKLLAKQAFKKAQE